MEVECDDQFLDTEEEEDDDKFRNIHEQWITKSQQILELKAEAGKWKDGRWTPRETKTLKENVQKFLEKEKIKNPAQIIFGEKDAIRSKFFHSAARNIPRPLFFVYRKICREFDVDHYVHKWSTDLEQQLLREYELHGNRWAIIGKALGISGSAARDKHRNITGRLRTGEWLPDEEARLVAAMLKLDGRPEMSWGRVANLVKTRNGPQCFTKWQYSRPALRERGEEAWSKRRWDKRDNLRLLQQLFDDKADDEEEVDWTKLCCGWLNARSPHFLRMKWSCLRRSVPGYDLKAFEENLEYLVEHLMPALERRIEREQYETTTLDECAEFDGETAQQTED